MFIFWWWLLRVLNIVVYVLEDIKMEFTAPHLFELEIQDLDLRLQLGLILDWTMLLDGFMRDASTLRVVSLLSSRWRGNWMEIG